MATHTVNIDVIDKTIPIGNNRVIPVINQPNPALGYAASANEVAQLLRLANYYVYEAGTDTIINPYNYYDYFPEAGGGGGGGGGGGVTPQTVQSMIDASIDSTVSDTSTKAVQNAAITNFVNSSIESSTAEFKGTYDSKAEMDEVTANQNDYAFLRVLNNDGSVNHYERYKWSDTEVSGSHWLFEYNVNNSSFTAEQWAAINSGIKDTDVSALGGHVNNTNNPHSVTKSQVGLSDVDNTSDADKPISTATQTALNTKFDTAGTGLNKNGTTVSHATPEGAATHAKAFYKFSTDALGHVNGVTEATEAEVDAIDSGITAAKVGQIETNKNNILSTAVYGTCDTAGATAAKIVDVPSGFVLRAGCVLAVRFTNSNSASNVTLNVGNSGDKSIRLASTIYLGSRTNITGNAGYTIFYMYDGTYWCWISHGNQPLGMTAVEASAGTSTADRFISAKVLSDAIDERIQPLENNILTVADQSTRYNLINLHDPIAVRNVVPTYLSDGGVTLDVNNAKWTAFNISYPSIVGVKYKFVVRITATTGLSNFHVFIRDTEDGTNVAEYPTGINNAAINSVGTHVFEFAATATTMWIGFYPNNSSTVVTGSVTMKAQIIEKSLYDAGFTDYQPYALPNTAITPVLKECANNGVKNICDWANANEKIRQGLSNVTKTDTSLAITSSGAWGHIAYTIGTLPAGEYIAMVKITNYSVASATCRFGIASATDKTTPISGNGVVTYGFSLNEDRLVNLYFYANWNETAYINSYTASDIMIITKALYDAGFTEYQPYALSNAELAAKEQANENNISSIYTQNGRSYNILDLSDVAYMASSITYSFDNATGSVIGSCTTATYQRIVWNLPITIGIRYRIDFDVASYNSAMMLYPTKATIATAAPYGQVDITAAGHYSLEFTPDVDTLYLCLYFNTDPAKSNSITIRNLRIIPKSAYDAGFNEFVPYALSNAVITPALKECVDNGVKNLINTTIANLKANNEAGTWNGNKYTVNAVEWTINDDGSVKVKSLNSTHSESLLWYYNNKSSMPQNIKVGDRIHASSKTNTNNTGISVWNSINGTSWNTQIMTDNNNEINIPQDTTGLGIRLLVMANQSVDTTLYPMICSADDWAVSPTYQPYALSNAKLTEDISYLENTGKKNWLKPSIIRGIPTGMTIQYESDDSLTINGTYNGSEYAYVFLYSFTHEAMSYTMSCNVATAASTFYFYTRDDKMSSTSTPKYTYMEQETTEIVMRIAPNTSFNNVNVKLMIRPSIITDSTYQPHALSNAELTAQSQKAISTIGNTSKLRLTLNTSAMSNSNRGSLLLSIPFQTSSYDNALLLIAIGNDSFLGVQRLDNSNNSMVTSWALSENNTILDITLRAQPWSAPVAFPLAQVAPPITYSWES